MKKILFICHGNICRSPMAEFVMKHIVKNAGLEKQFEIASAATHNDVIGCDIHHGTRKKLTEQGVPFERRQARRIVANDYEYYDYLVGMDDENLYCMEEIFGNDTQGKMFKLLEFAGSDREVADPWYTGDFDATWDDIVTGCNALLSKIM